MQELATAEANVLAADPPTHEGGGGATVPPPVDKALQVLQGMYVHVNTAWSNTFSYMWACDNTYGHDNRT